MQVDEVIKKIRTDALLRQFDNCAFTLGFFVQIPEEPRKVLDTEFAISTLPSLLENESLSLERFIGVSLTFLQRYHHLLDPESLFKKCTSAEQIHSGGESPITRLFYHFLWNLDSDRFQKFQPLPLSKPYYPEPILAELTDMKIQERGFFKGLDPSLGLMIPEGAFRLRESDVLPEKILFERNEQLKNRHLFGVNSCSDVEDDFRSERGATSVELDGEVGFAMSVLDESDTGLPGLVILVFDGKFISRRSHHQPQIWVTKSESTKVLARISIETANILDGNLSEEMLADVRRFLAKNKDVLLAYWNRTVSTKGMVEGIKPLTDAE
jgi:hypothetical protein